MQLPMRVGVGVTRIPRDRIGYDRVGRMFLPPFSGARCTYSALTRGCSEATKKNKVIWAFMHNTQSIDTVNDGMPHSRASFDFVSS